MPQNVLSLFSPSTVSDPRNMLVRKRHRTHVSTTDRLDCVYTPRLPVEARYALHFEPTMITKVDGEPSEQTVKDLMDARYQSHQLVTTG